jgi:hypothetical protein
VTAADLVAAPWSRDEEFDAARASRLVIDLRADKAALQAERDELRATAEADRTAAEQALAAADADRVAADTRAAASAIHASGLRADLARVEHALVVERALRRYGLPDEASEFLTGDADDVERIAARLAAARGRAAAPAPIPAPSAPVAATQRRPTAIHGLPR